MLVTTPTVLNQICRLCQDQACQVSPQGKSTTNWLKKIQKNVQKKCIKKIKNEHVKKNKIYRFPQVYILIS